MVAGGFSFTETQAASSEVTIQSDTKGPGQKVVPGQTSNVPGVFKPLNRFGERGNGVLWLAEGHTEVVVEAETEYDTGG
jgi:hypothetical protein